MSPPILAITAQKGGVGKTTTTIQLALALARRGHKVLVIDLDQQGCATELLGGSSTANDAHALLTGAHPLSALVQITASGVDLVAGSQALESFDLEVGAREGREVLLQQALATAPADRWDFVLLDCPPSLGLVVVNALVAASAVLAPVPPALLPLKAIGRLEETIATVQAQLNPALRSLGYLLTMVNEREAVTAPARAQLRAHAGAQVWKTEIRVDAGLKVAPGARRRGRGTKDYETAAAELLRRLRRM